MRIAFAALPAYGHLYPVMPLALACAEAGHDVSVATGEPFLGRLPLPTWLGQPADLDLEGAFAETRRRHPEATGRDLVIAMFADTTAGFVSDLMIARFADDRPDLVVYEAMDVGVGVAADVLGIPAVAYSIGLGHLGAGMIHRAAVSYHAGLWSSLDRTPPHETSLLARVLLDPTPRSLGDALEAVEVSRLPIRPVAFSETAGAVPSWLTAPRTRRRVYLTLGTVSFGAVEVLCRAIAEISALDVDVLVAVGPGGDPAALGAVADNVHVETFVAQSQILPLVDLVVHHGGTGTVLGALAEGLPQLILPQGADQFMNAQVLTQVGAARALLNEEQLPGAIQANASALLGAGTEREVAARLRDEIAAQPAPAEVVPQLVELAR